MSTDSAPSSRPWYYRLGPGLITACVVIGPGSIVSSSKVGANQQYSMLWVVLVSVIFMMLYMTVGARLGVIAAKAPGDLIRERAGKGLAILVGFCAFFISAAFQSGNNIGVGAAFKVFVDSEIVVSVLIVAFNAVAISFLYVFKDLYRMLERVMMCFVALMLICFAINLVLLGPDLGALLKGLIPSRGVASGDGDTRALILNLLALVGTTFVITAAYYQAYLVRQKGWKEPELKSGLLDARIGSIIMFLITVMLMSTAAAGLYREGEEVSLNNPVEVATALETTFGASAKIIFCFGLFSAAYSSFLVNSMIGGFILSDSLNLGSDPSGKWPKIMTTAALLTGMIIALASTLLGFDRTPTLIFAQAVTVLGAPLIAVVLLWLSSSQEIMGEKKNSTFVNVLGAVGLVLLLGMAYRTAFHSIPSNWESWTNPPSKEASAEPAGIEAEGSEGSVKEASD